MPRQPAAPRRCAGGGPADDAGRQAAEHEHQAAARWDRLVASYHAQHAAARQAKIDALLLETIAALASLFSTNNPSSTEP